ncbi:hypothetical protein BDA96_10G287200 [Sorghum bicolor]|uniref:Uncharacterized protein n=1 Tax=Sorghum bicolor TaxID=4558 RepID=A0A921Q5Y7_SORBI|nr:hypothetical protein BDA96_10G287200 [Sorghum bicolor]
MGAGTTLSPDAMDLVTRAKATRRRTPTVRDPGESLLFDTTITVVDDDAIFVLKLLPSSSVCTSKSLQLITSTIVLLASILMRWCFPQFPEITLHVAKTEGNGNIRNFSLCSLNMFL